MFSTAVGDHYLLWEFITLLLLGVNKINNIYCLIIKFPLGFLQSFFGFGQSADIEIKLDGTDTRKLADIKSDDGKKEKFYLYYDGESVTGQVGFFFFLLSM